MTSPNEIVAATTMLANDIAQVARTAIGPNGVMIQMPEEDAGLMRASFVTGLAEAAMKILDTGDGGAETIK